jgi:hypothetical protein
MTSERLTSSSESDLSASDSELKDLEDEHNEDSDFQNEDELEDLEDQEEEEVLTMDRVRFNSLCILPSQIECCSLDYYEKQDHAQK